MKRSRLHLFALFAAFWTLLVAMSGAAITSSARNEPNPTSLLTIHTAASVADLFLIGFLAIWLLRSGSPVALSAWGSLALLLAEAGSAALVPPGPLAGTLHACLSALSFVAVAAIAHFTSATWELAPEFAEDSGWPSLRFLSKATALLVLTQVGFGAGFRHRAVGMMPHLFGALLVALVITIAGLFVTTQFPKHPVLRPMAVAFLVTSGVQVMLGFGAFLLRMMEPAGHSIFVAISVAHVAIGSLTLAFSVLLAIEIQRTVLPRAPQTA